MYEDMDYAAQNGNLSEVIELHRYGKKCTTDAMDLAAANGHLNVVQWLHQNRKEGCTAKAMDLAAANGHLGVIQWLNQNRDEGCTTDAMDLAAKNNHLHIVRWLHENRKEGCTNKAIFSAIRNSNLDLFHLLKEEKPTNKWYCVVAARHDNLDALIELNKTFEFDEHVLTESIMYGSTRCTDYILQHLSLNRNATHVPDSACEVGDHKTLAKLLACGYRASIWTLMSAIRGGSMDCFKTVMSMCVLPNATMHQIQDVFTECVRYNRPKMMEIMLHAGFRPNNVGRVKELAYVMANGILVDGKQTTEIRPDNQYYECYMAI